MNIKTLLSGVLLAVSLIVPSVAGAKRGTSLEGEGCMKRHLAVAIILGLSLIVLSTTLAAEEGVWAGRTQCFINGQWVTVTGNCPASGGVGNRSSRREREPKLTQEELQRQLDQQYNQRESNIGLKYFNAALNYEEAGMWADAEREFREANGHIGNWLLFWHMAYVLEQQGKYEEALKWSDKAVGWISFTSSWIKDDRVAVKSQRGYLEFLLGRYALAKMDLEDALNIDPNNSFARNILNQLTALKKEQTDKGDRKNLMSKLDSEVQKDDLKNLKDQLNKQGEVVQTPPPEKLKNGADRQALINKKTAIVDDLVKKVKSDQNAIRNLGLYDKRDPEKRAKDFEAWAKLSAKAKIDLEKEFFEASLQVAEVAVNESIAWGASKALKPIKSLNPFTVNKQIAWLKSKGVTDPYLFDLMRAVAKTPGKPELAKKLIERLRLVNEVSVAPSSLFGTVDAEKSHEVLNHLGLVLGIINPTYKILLADLRFTTASIYNNVTRRATKSHIESLTKLTEDQLKQLNNLNKRLIKHVKQLNDEKKELARLTQIN